MPSLAKIFSFAAVAFTAFAAAAPTNFARELVEAEDNKITNTVNAFNSRSCACADDDVPSLIGIVATLKANVDVHVKALAAITVETCKVDVVKPIVLEIVGTIQVAIDAVVKLGKYEADKFLFDGHAVVDIKIFAKLLAEVIVSICAAIEVVLRLCVHLTVDLKVEIHALLCLIGVAIATLIRCICDIVGHLIIQLVAVLCIELKACFRVFVHLKLSDIILLLKINVNAYINL
jgi:hypothetical protein